MGSKNGKVTCGNCPAGYVNNGVNSCSEVVDRCKKNNGGCHGKRKCTSTNGKVTCGNCPAGYANDGAKGCKAAAAEEECKIIGTMHGKHVTTFTNLVGYTGCKGQPGLHILIHHDGNKHYKMVGININDAKTSSTPKAIAKYVTAAKGSVPLTNENVCKMFKGEGYSPRVYDYQAKDVTVVCGGSAPYYDLKDFAGHYDQAYSNGHHDSTTLACDGTVKYYETKKLSGNMYPAGSKLPADRAAQNN